MFHVDDARASNEDIKVVDNFEQWIDCMYGDQNTGKVKSARGKSHEYLSMTLDYNKKEKFLLFTDQKSVQFDQIMRWWSSNLS